MSETVVEQSMPSAAKQWNTPIAGIERAAGWLKENASHLPTMVSIYAHRTGAVEVSLGTTYSRSPESDFWKAIRVLFAGKPAQYTKRGGDETWSLHDELRGLTFRWHRYATPSEEATSRQEVVI